MKGGPVVTFEALQLMVNGSHCVVGEEWGEAARGEKRAKAKNNVGW